ncbi:MAG: hypothetical protein Kow0089_19710 [Desulfobulbaceae bacterium]
MKKFLFHLLLITAIMLTARFAAAATEAEASTGGETATVGKYDLSGMTEEEREWFVTFLNGNFFADGWESIASEILENTPAEQRNQVRVRLDELGYKIGREWCRGNDTRKIDTSLLRQWGSELQNTAEDRPHLLAEVLNRIDREVDQLLD